MLSRRHLETKIQALEAEGQGLEQQAIDSEKMYKAQVTTRDESCDVGGATFAVCDVTCDVTSCWAGGAGD